ncbi:MAG: hypothetical protein JWP76_1832 [Dactylosporangium sp.]|nr:hypothetical protein [Dactylosporangium sp.]
MAYATVQDLTDELGFTPGNGQILLDRASRDVDRAINSAIYATDSTGQPTDPTITKALKEATLEQVAYQLEVGNTDGIRHGLQSGVPSGASAGGVSLSRGQSVGGATSDLPWLADQAEWILRQAGLRGQPPQTYTWQRFI